MAVMGRNLICVYIYVCVCVSYLYICIYVIYIYTCHIYIYTCHIYIYIQIVNWDGKTKYSINMGNEISLFFEVEEWLFHQYKKSGSHEAQELVTAKRVATYDQQNWPFTLW